MILSYSLWARGDKHNAPAVSTCPFVVLYALLRLVETLSEGPGYFDYEGIGPGGGLARKHFCGDGGASQQAWRCQSARTEDYSLGGLHKVNARQRAARLKVVQHTCDTLGDRVVVERAGSAGGRDGKRMIRLNVFERSTADGAGFVRARETGEIVGFDTS